MKPLNRREALELCVLSFMAISTGCTDTAHLSTLQTSSMDGYAKQLAHIKSCRTVGRDWTDEQSPPFDPKTAYQQLFSDSETASNVKAMQAKLHIKRRHDFETGRIINRNGWLLSETELTLFALLSVA
jgi:hypothetical protein